MSAPVQHIGNATLYLGDCLSILPALGKVNAVVTDPPYGIGYDPSSPSVARMNRLYAGGIFTSNSRMIAGDNASFDPTPLLRLNLPTILWGAQNYADKLQPTNGWLVWDKTRGGRANNGFRKSEAELAWTSFLGRINIIDHLWHGLCRDSEIGFPVLHTTQKPIAVMEWAIQKLPFACETILDPFMGSGTTGVACAKLGRKFIGIEIEPRYFDIACKRIEQAYAQPDMFIEPPSKPKQEELLV